MSKPQHFLKVNSPQNLRKERKDKQEKLKQEKTKPNLNQEKMTKL